MFAMKKINLNISQILRQVIFSCVKVQFFINKYLVNMLNISYLRKGQMHENADSGQESCLLAGGHVFCWVDISLSQVGLHNPLPKSSYQRGFEEPCGRVSGVPCSSEG